MDELERRHIEEQLGGAREELASMREELDHIREALSRAIREWMVKQAEKEQAEQGGPAPN